MDYHNPKPSLFFLSSGGKRNVCELMRRKTIGLARLMIM